MCGRFIFSPYLFFAQMETASSAIERGLTKLASTYITIGVHDEKKAQARGWLALEIYFHVARTTWRSRVAVILPQSQQYSPM